MAKLTISQLRAIKKAATIGRKIKKEMPYIAEDYSGGHSKRAIVNKYDIHKRYGVGVAIATNAVAYAIIGNNRISDQKPYKGLITDNSKLERIAKRHQAIAFNSMTLEERRANGKRAYESKKGVHGFTKEERTINSSKGGKIAVNTKAGIHGLSEEQKAENRRKAMIASGKTPYTTEEKQKIFELSKHPNYRTGKGPSYNQIAEQINQDFHNGEPIRTRSAVNYVLFRGKK